MWRSVVRSKVIKLVIGFIFVLLILWLLDENDKTIQGQAQDEQGFTVTVLEVAPRNKRVQVETTGIVQSRWPLDVLANVSGKLTLYEEGIEAGTEVKQGQLLAQINDVDYKSEVAAAEARISQAELELSRYQYEQTVAKQVGKGNRLTPFGQFVPHIKAAEAELVSANAALASANDRLKETSIRAPFDAMVLHKHIVPGQWVNSGDLLFRLASSETKDVIVELSSQEWNMLGELSDNTQNKTQNKAIEVVGSDGSVRQANIRFINPTLMAQTRQRSVMLEIHNDQNSYSTLLPEQQVIVRFQGKQMNNVVTAPATSLTRDNKVWSVVDGVLKLEDVMMVDEQPETISFQFVQQPQQSRQLVVFPLSSMLEGQAVILEPMAQQGGGE